MTRHNFRRSTGFTLVELMLAMAFVSLLLMGIAVTSLRILNTYSKGLTIKEVNQAGRTITEDIQRTIASSTRFIVSPARTTPTDGIDSEYVTQPGGGRLCTGTYTYAWNYGNTSQLSGATTTPVYNTFSDSSDVIRLVKVNDIGGVLCSDMGRAIQRAQAKDLLRAGDRNLAVQQLTVSSNSEDPVSGQQLYSISVVLGTNDQSQLNASTTCKPPSGGNGFEQFCAINQFDIVARAGNRSGSL